MEVVVLYVMAGLSAFATLWTVCTVGKPKKPTDPTGAAATVLVGGLYIAFYLHLATLL